MSILVNSDAFPQAVRAVYDLLKFMPGTAEELSRLLVPHSHLPADERYRDGTDILKSAIGEAKALRLIQEVDAVLSVPQPLPDDRTYLTALCRAVLSEDERFRSAAQWLLLQDAYRAPTEKSFDDYQKNSAGLIQFISNGTQFSNFQRWVRYLGLAREVGGELMPDPSRAIKYLWPDVMETGEYPIAEAYAQLSAALPVLPTATNSKLPSSVSYALKGLERAGRCELKSHSDAEKWTLTLPHGGHSLVSHILVTKVKA